MIKVHEFEIGGKKYKAKLTFGAVRKIEELSGGKSFYQVVTNVADNTANAVLNIMYATMLRYHPDMTIQKLEEIIDNDDNLSFLDIMVIGKRITNDIMDEEPEKKKEITDKPVLKNLK